MTCTMPTWSFLPLSGEASPAGAASEGAALSEGAADSEGAEPQPARSERERARVSSIANSFFMMISPYT